MLRFIGHVERINDKKQVLHSRVSEEAQARGASPMNYRQAIIKAFNSFGIKPLE